MTAVLIQADDFSGAAEVGQCFATQGLERASSWPRTRAPLLRAQTQETYGSRPDVLVVVVTHNIPSARRLGDELVMLHEGSNPRARDGRGVDRSDNEMVHAFMQSQHSG